MRRTFKYGFFVGRSPVCPVRVRDYPDLLPIAEAYVDRANVFNPDEFDPEDLRDTEHQWAYSTGVRLMQRCFEKDCTAVRPVPLDAYPEADRAFILRDFMQRNLKEN